MNYLELLPCDIVSEICLYLTEVETKHIIQLRGYCDTNLMIKYINNEDSLMCCSCERHDRHRNMKTIQGSNYCEECANNITYCGYDGCESVAKTIYVSCETCSKTYCEWHKDNMEMCRRCGEWCCDDHIIMKREYTVVSNYTCYKCSVFNRKNVDNLLQ